MWSSLGPWCSEICAPPRPERLSPSPDWGSFQQLPPQRHFAFFFLFFFWYPSNMNIVRLDWSHSSPNILSFLETLLSFCSFRISCVNYIFMLYVVLGGGLCLTSHAAIFKPILSVVWLLYTDVVLTEGRGQLLHG